MSIRTTIYNIVNTVCRVYAVQDKPARVTENCAVIVRKSANESFNNSLAGWDNWIIYLYSPHSPLQIDKLRNDVRRALFKNDIEITHDMSDDIYDEYLKCYVCSITCRTPMVFDYFE